MRQRSFVLLALAVALLLCGTAMAVEIPKSSMTLSTNNDPWSSVYKAVNGNVAEDGFAMQGVGWLRIKMSHAWKIERFDYQPRFNHPNGRTKDWELYVTDSSSTNKADWGEPVATSATEGFAPFPNVDNSPPVQVTLPTPKDGTYVILNCTTSWSDYAGAMEIWIHGSAADLPCFERFEVVNALGLRTLFTAGRTVNVAITPVAGALSLIAGYVITESADVPGEGAAWSSSVPASYTIAGAPGTVNLWAWAKDGLGNVANISTWIVYSPNQIAIPKNQMTWQTSDGSNAAGAFNGDPLDTGWHGNTGGGVGGWLRITLANRYHVERFDYQPRTTHENGRIKDYEIYITDINSTSMADWGAPVASGRFPNVTGGGPTIQVALNPARDGKYLILRAVNSYNYFGAAEVWAYGWAATNPGVAQFDVFNDARNTNLFFGTREVATTIAGVTDGVDDIAGYVVTESATPPGPEAAWTVDPPTAYTVVGDPGSIDLYAWVKDSSGDMGWFKRTIVYDPTVAAVSNVLIRPYGPDKATATWTTDIQTFGRVQYRAVGDADWSYTAWESARTVSHSVLFTGLVVDASYEVIVANNETDEAAEQYDHYLGQTQIARSAMIATSAISGSNPPASIDNNTATSWNWYGVSTGFLRLNLGDRYSPTMFTYLGRMEHQNGRIANYKIYVTDDASDVEANWGTPVASGTFPQFDAFGKVYPQTVELTPQDGRYLYLMGLSNYGGPGAAEVWVFGVPAANPGINAFTVVDQTNLGSVYTDTTTVDVTAFDVQLGAAPITGYMILETADVPDPDAITGWLPDVPLTHTITTDVGFDGASVTLYAWVKDANKRMGSLSTAIFFNPNPITVSDVQVTMESLGSATVTWTTDTKTLGVAEFRPANGDPDTWTASALESAAAFSHTRVIAPLDVDSSYVVRVRNLETTDTASYAYDNFLGLVQIPRTDMTAVVSSEGNAGNVIDGNPATFWAATYQTPTPNQWIRVDLGKVYNLQTLGYLPRIDHPNGRMKDYEIYVTNNDSLVKADWGSPVASGSFFGGYPIPDYPNLSAIPAYRAEPVDLTGQTGRYVIIYGKTYYGACAGAGEVYFFGEEAPTIPVVTSFVVSDTTTGSTLVTNEATVTVAVTAEAPADQTIAGYLITETADQPALDAEGWTLDPPESYTIAGDEGDVTLRAWVKDSTGQLGVKSTTIYFRSSVTVTNAGVAPSAPGTAFANWNTDVETYGSVQYRAYGDVDFTTVSQAGRLTSHSILISGLLTDVNYEVVIVNNLELSGPTIWYPRQPVPVVTAFTVADQSTGSALFTNSATVNVSASADAPQGLTIDGYMITETGAAPEPGDPGWNASLAGYTIIGGEGSVTLYAWAKDSSGGVSAAQPASIFFSTAAPVVSNVAVADNGDGTATVTWTTDIQAEGGVKFGTVALAGTTPNTVPENALGTAHSVTIGGIVSGANCKLVLVNNEVSASPFYWPLAWPIEGDANGDCRVNILDLIFIRNKLNQSVETGDNWKADVNQDTRINILDLIFVRNKLNTQCP